MAKIRRAVISVFDKTGVAAFARGLTEMGVEILSTGGTAARLREAGIEVRDISDFTGFPEMMDGRIKTLHPRVHGGLLFRRDDQGHLAACEKAGIEPIDLVCVNLYPFEATVARPNVTFDEAIENIDIGGPTMLRAAAKNMAHVTATCDPNDYDRILEEMRSRDGATGDELRRNLARKVFAHVTEYNAAIANYLASELKTPNGFEIYSVACSSGHDLRYGENPHQSAVFYCTARNREACVAHSELLHGKPMSYNNYVDGDAAVEAMKELSGAPAAAIIKHTNPCGYATGSTLAEALQAAWAGDPVSAFGSVIAVTRRMDLAAAEVLKGRFVEAVIAPGFDDDALAYLREKSKHIRLLALRHEPDRAASGRVVRQINGGWLVQDRDVDLIAQWYSPTATPFPEEKKPLAEFGVKACKHVKSNAIVLAREHKPGYFAVLGMGAGQPNRVDAVRKLAIAKAHENITLLMQERNSYGRNPQAVTSRIMGGAVLASDAFFPFPDNIHHAAEAGIRYIVQPGGSKRDEEVIAACDKYGIAMAFTGMRHFKH